MVLCRSAGYEVVISSDETDVWPQTLAVQTGMMVSCTGKETTIFECDISIYETTQHTPDLFHAVVECAHVELIGGRTENEGILVLHREQHPAVPITLDRIDKEGAQELCRRMGFADVVRIIKSRFSLHIYYSLFDLLTQYEVMDMSCLDGEHDWWNCDQLDMSSLSNPDVFAVGLVCRPFNSIASVTSFDHWSMEMVLPIIPMKEGTPDEPLHSPSADWHFGSMTTTTTTASPAHIPMNHTGHSHEHRRSAPEVTTCTLYGSFFSGSFDDITLHNCDMFQDERGPVNDALLAISGTQEITFPQIPAGENDHAHLFCVDDQCPDGFALAYWFTLPPCTKPALTIFITNGLQKCFKLEAVSRIRMKYDDINDDGQITLSTVDWAMDDKPEYSSELLYSRTFTSTPYETTPCPGCQCRDLVWNHVALNIHRPNMTCELYINGDSEVFDCKPLQGCLSSEEGRLNLVAQLGTDVGLDEVGLWQRPLDENEVKSLYHQPTDIPETFTGIPLWAVPKRERSNNCPCEEVTAMEVLEYVEDKEEIDSSDLIQVAESLLTITNKTDFSLITDMRQKYDAVQSSLDTISTIAHLGAKKVKKSAENTADLQEVGHNILGSLDHLQNALLNDGTIVYPLISDLIEIVMEPAEPDMDFLYRSDETGIGDGGTSVRIPSENFNSGSRVSVAHLREFPAAFLPTRLARRNGSTVLTNVTSSVISVHTTGVNVNSMKENLSLTIPHRPNTMKPKGASFLCAFYETNSRHFSARGCTVVQRISNDQSTTCSCNHMTSFAILMAVTDIAISRGNELSLDVITYTGCSLSIVALVFSLIVIGVSKLKSIRIRILTNQCVAMLLAQSLFISAVKNASVNKVACKVVAVFLHLFFLAVMFWMLVQGVYMYSKTTMLHKAVIPLKYFIVVGWGVPVVIVAATIAADINFYGSEDTCWLNRENGGIWIFVVPALVIAVINGIIMILTVRVLRTVKVFQNKTDREKIKSTVKATIVILPILGVTWITGILVNISVIFSYLFAIFNAFQGVFLFIMQILINAEIRSALRLRKSRILPFNTSSILDRTVTSNNTASTNKSHTTRTGVGVVSISGSQGSVIGEQMPPAE
ncbi:adhesion G-protein coupled receptor G4-like isoform X2 [Lytechinus variegatus]|nr:adhesion G-protein coupled receptor G4-like isoform X2 [Lytechinus variegatus]